ncbi:MAG: hypothetical protein LBU22_04725 [Dysgonamonadaceae bacterium]|jgi:hypothetical protein|nr:hypothetical protein [Dysgonamonadaceae bacterium]
MYNEMLLRKCLLLIVVFFAGVVAAIAQNCDCERNFVWVKKTFEENDAGFRYVIDKKGLSEYEKQNVVVLEKVKSAQNNYECAEILNNWLHFFRKNHIGIEVLRNDDIAESPQQTVKSFPDWEKVSIDTLLFKHYLHEKKELDIEGIWDDEVYKIGIKNINGQYIGFIISSMAEEWKTGQVKFKIYPDSVIYYMLSV